VVASVHLNLDNFPEAIRLKQESLQILQSIYGNEHDYIAGTLDSLGNMYLKSSDQSAAGQAFAESLAIMETLLTADHPSLAYPLTSLGRLSLQQNQLNDALAYLDRAYALRFDGLPENHWLIGLTGELLGDTYLVLGQAAEAKSYYEIAKRCFTTTFGDTDERAQAVATKLNNLN